VISGTGINRLAYWDICVAATTHNKYGTKYGIHTGGRGDVRGLLKSRAMVL